MAVKIGVIAEEVNDVEVLYELTCHHVQENKFSLRKFVGHGCGKLRRKCRAWGENLLRSGCTHLVVMHDLDTRDATLLHKELSSMTGDIAFETQLILLPKREIEAWLLSDPNGVKYVFNIKGNVRMPNRPEEVSDPKRALRDLIQPAGKIYLNTLHNKRLAEASDVRKIAKKCESYRPYPKFLSKIFDAQDGLVVH